MLVDSKIFLASLITGVLSTPIAQAAQSEGIDPQAGLPFWDWTDESVEIRLIQRLPDQTRGFFIGRGFTAAAADRIAENCIFQTILRNLGAGVESPEIGISLAQWRLDAGSGPRPLAMKEDWDLEWEAMGESEAARIAFRWSLFPTDQGFRGGDYNWGMISVGAAPGTRFDLSLTWTLDGEARQALLRGVTCAPETDPDNEN